MVRTRHLCEFKHMKNCTKDKVWYYPFVIMLYCVFSCLQIHGTAMEKKVKNCKVFGCIKKTVLKPSFSSGYRVQKKPWKSGIFWGGRQIISNWLIKQVQKNLSTLDFLSLFFLFICVISCYCYRTNLTAFSIENPCLMFLKSGLFLLGK